MSGPIVAAVKRAVSAGSDNWEIEYYRGAGGDWDERRSVVYSETRARALGPSWCDFIRCRMMVEGMLPLAEGVLPRAWL